MSQGQGRTEMPHSDAPAESVFPPAHALVVVDVQNAFVLEPDAVPEGERLLERVGTLSASARAAGAPVIFLQNDGPAGAADEPPHWGWQLSLAPAPGDEVVRKTRDDGFEGTDLGEILRRFAVRSIVVCGTLSEMCVAATARAAMERGFIVLLPHDAHATYDVPAGPGSAGVPAAMAARAAEWSLGDEVRICASAQDVRFTQAAGRQDPAD